MNETAEDVIADLDKEESIEETELHASLRNLLTLKGASQGTVPWLIKRDTMITASKFCDVLGTVNHLSRKKSVFFLLNVRFHLTQSRYFREKLGFIKPVKPNMYMQHGSRNEARARDLYCEKTGATVYEFGCISHADVTWANREPISFIGGSPDGVTEQGVLIEIKCPIKRKPTTEVPDYYVDQIQGLLHILDLKEADYIQYIPADYTMDGEEFIRIIRTYRDETWLTTNLPKFKSFQNELDEAWRLVEECRKAVSLYIATMIKYNTPDGKTGEVPMLLKLREGNYKRKMFTFNAKYKSFYPRKRSLLTSNPIQKRGCVLLPYNPSKINV